ncbi:MAG TPA: flagellar basal body rod protein FlgC [Terracidiphilus sp.]|jgi:flagellar basal-body rod protein FlgC
MNLFGMMEASGQAMEAERMRAEVVAANMANAETTRTEQGGPYRRQEVIFAANGGDANFLDSMNDSISGSGSGSVADSMTGATGNAGGEMNLLGEATSVPALPPLLPLAGARDAAPGVHISQVVEDPSPPLKRYDPGHPDAGPDGYVSYPDINPLTEMVDLMGATRAYGLNGSALQAEKGMITSALEIAKS